VTRSTVELERYSYGYNIRVNAFVYKAQGESEGLFSGKKAY